MGKPRKVVKRGPGQREDKRREHESQEDTSEVTHMNSLNIHSTEDEVNRALTQWFRLDSSVGRCTCYLYCIAGRQGSEYVDPDSYLKSRIRMERYRYESGSRTYPVFSKCSETCI